MEIVECEPREYLDEIKEVKETALRDANAFDEDDSEPDYSDFKCFLIGRVEGKVVATAAYRRPKGDVVEALKITENTAELKNNHVLPEYQRKGFASELVKAVEKRALEDGYSKMVLRTTSLQTKAHQFYRSNGYKELKRTSPSYRDIDYELVFFKKNL